MNALRVVFVCTGNICRSPTAEALLRHHAAGLTIVADSCGVSAEESGNPPHPMSVAELRRNGVEPPDRRARRVRTSDFTDARLLVPMTEAHEAALYRLRPGVSRAEIRRLMTFAPDLAADVPDPWYIGTREAYAQVFSMIDRGVQGLVTDLRAELG